MHWKLDLFVWFLWWLCKIEVLNILPQSLQGSLLLDDWFLQKHMENHIKITLQNYFKLGWIVDFKKYDNLVIINPPFLRQFCVFHFIGNRSFELIFSNFDVIQQRWRGLLFGFWNVARYEKILWVIGGPPLSAMLYWLKLLKYW